MRRFGVLSILLVLLLGSAFAQRGARVAPRNLAELTRQAERIILGRVLSASTEKHPQFTNLSTVVVTLSVEETWKGEPARTYTFRQFVWDPRDRFDHLGYKKGLHVVLMMNPVNENGLTSPAGLTQGRFTIIERDGKQEATNSANNIGLLDGPAVKESAARGKLSKSASQLVTTHREGSIPLADLREIVRELAGGAR